MEHSSDRPEKLNFQASQHVFDDVLVADSNIVAYLYHVEFYKSMLLVAEMHLAFDHVLSREEFVRVLQSYDEVRNERYDAKCRSIEGITMAKLIELRKKLVIERGAYRMSPETIKAQDDDAIVESAVNNLLAVDKQTKQKAHKSKDLKQLLKKGGFI